MSTQPINRRFRPVSGLSSTMRVSLYRNAESLNKRKQKIYRINSLRLPNIQSEQPEAIYNWLDSFDSSLKPQIIGKAYQYPECKFKRSKAISNSWGYRTTVYMHKKSTQYEKYRDEVLGKTVSAQLQRTHNNQNKIIFRANKQFSKTAREQF